MLDKLLDIGASFDWITPTWAFIQDAANGNPADFGIPANAGFDRGDIKRLLSKRGINVWGLMYNTGGDLLMFTVHKSQARQTRTALQQAGVPILYAPATSVDREQERRAIDDMLRHERHW